MEDYKQILGILARRLHSEPNQWRHVYKSLLLLEYMAKNGPERMVAELKSNGRVFTKLQQFQYLDSKNKDQGINVRNRWALLCACVQRLRHVSPFSHLLLVHTVRDGRCRALGGRLPSQQRECGQPRLGICKCNAP